MESLIQLRDRRVGGTHTGGTMAQLARPDLARNDQDEITDALAGFGHQ